MNEWAILGLGVVAVVAAVYFFFIRVKTDPRVRELADLAYETAARIAGEKPRGSTPPVRLKPEPWVNRGVTVIGNYKSFGFFGKVFWDSILVVGNPLYIWPNMVHEMTHAIRRRNGKPTSETAAEVAEARASQIRSPEVDALLEKL